MSDYLHKVLLEESTEQHHINYNTFFINHFAQGIIALWRLGATEERINRFIQWYRIPMTPGRARGFQEPPGVIEKSVEDLLGSYQGYYKIYDHYEDLFNKRYGKSLEKFIVGEFPNLAPGLSGGAYHGLIHLGYGYSAKNWRVVVEGMAYLHFVFERPVLKDEILLQPIVQGEESPLKILEELKNRKDLIEIGKRNPILPHKGFFIAMQGGLLANDKACTDLLAYVKRMKLPKPDDKHSLGDVLVDLCLSIYVQSARKNDFFLLHGGTSSWAFKQILPLFKNDEKFINLLYHTFSVGLLATYLAVTAPDMISEQLTAAPVENLTWDEIMKRLLAEDVDEHIFKIVQVAHDMFKEHKENERLYKAVALCALDQKFAHVQTPYPNMVITDPHATSE